MGIERKDLGTKYLNRIPEYLSSIRPESLHVWNDTETESRFGYDSTVLGTLPQFWRTAVFQFKRALSKRITHLGDEYSFHINNNGNRDQQILLYLMSGGKPFTALYVPPLFTTLNDVRNQSPHLLGRTAYVDAIDIPPWLVNNSPHTLLVYPRHRLGIVQSNKKEIKLLTSEEIIDKISKKEIGVSIEELRRNLKTKHVEGAETRSRRPRFTFQIFPSST